MVINLSKCVFGASKVRYLGYLLNEKGTKPLPDRVTAVLNYEKPSNVSQLRRFLGMLNFYRQSLKHAAEIQAPLHKYLIGSTKKDLRPIEWTPEAETAFDQCKQQLANATLLHYPLMNAKLCLQCDASNLAMGAVLEQWNNGTWEALGFFSKKFNDAQRNYSTYDRELLAIYNGIKFFRHMVEGRPLKIKTDHKPLTFAFDQKPEKASPRQLRQLDFISQFSTDIVYIAGENNVTADALSRISEIEMPVLFTTEDLSDAQKYDEELQDLLKSNSSLNMRKLPMTNSDTYLYCDISTDEIRPYIPKNLRQKIFDLTHGFSHPNGRVTQKLISKKFVWPGMNKDIKEWARSCLACQRLKIGRHVKLVPEHIPTPNSRFTHVHLDIVGPLNYSQGYSYILTMIDRFTRWPEAVPIKNITAEAIVNIFYETWVSRFGAPRFIITDRGSQFESILFRAFTQLIGCQRTRTTAYHPAANGLVERWHRAMKAALMCLNTKDWVKILPTVLLGLRTSIKEDLGTTAAELVYGSPLRIPGEFFLHDETPSNPQTFVEHLKEQMRQVCPRPTAHHNKPRIFTHKDLYSCTHVFLRIDRTRKPLEPPFEGPYRVINRPSNKVFTLEIQGKAVTVSVERVKPAHLEVATSNPEKPKCSSGLTPDILLQPKKQTKMESNEKTPGKDDAPHLTKHGATRTFPTPTTRTPVKPRTEDQAMKTSNLTPTKPSILRRYHGPKFGHTRKVTFAIATGT